MTAMATIEFFATDAALAALTHTPGPQGPVPTGGGGSPPAAITAPPTGGSGATPLDWNVKVHTNPTFAGNPFLTPAPPPGQPPAPVATFVTKDALGSSVLYSHASPPPGAGEGSGGGAAPGLPAAYVDYTPYGAPLALTILASNRVVTATPVSSNEMLLALEFPLPDHLTGEVLFNQAVYLWNKPAGTRRLFEIIDRPTPTTLVVLAAPGELSADDILHLIRGDDPRFGLKDTLAALPVYDAVAGTTTFTLADARDVSAGGSLSAGAMVGAHLRPNSAQNETFEIVGYAADPFTGAVSISMRGDATALVTNPDHPVFIYARQLPLSPIAFAGYYHDSETGLNYAWNRFESPTTGRWLTRDPAGFPDGPNLYTFVHDNPANGVDPNGLKDPFEYLTDEMGHSRRARVRPIPTVPRPLPTTPQPVRSYPNSPNWRLSPGAHGCSTSQIEVIKQTYQSLCRRIDCVLGKLEQFIESFLPADPGITKPRPYQQYGIRSTLSYASLARDWYYKIQERLCTSTGMMWYECCSGCGLVTFLKSGWDAEPIPAYTIPSLSNVVRLCPRFFRQDEVSRQMTIIHEAAHLMGVEEEELIKTNEQGVVVEIGAEDLALDVREWGCAGGD